MTDNIRKGLTSNELMYLDLPEGYEYDKNHNVIQAFVPKSMGQTGFQDVSGQRRPIRPSERNNVDAKYQKVTDTQDYYITVNGTIVRGGKYDYY